MNLLDHIEDCEKKLSKSWLGKILEIFVVKILESLFPKKMGYRILHVNWDLYNTAMGCGIDIRVFKGCKQILQVECKNWRLLSKPYGTDIAESEIVPRFNNAGGLKITIMPTIQQLTESAIKLIRSKQIHIVEFGQQIKDLAKAFKSKAYYQIKTQIKKLVNRAKAEKDVVYPSIISSNTNNNHKHRDTDIEITGLEWLIEVVNEARKEYKQRLYDRRTRWKIKCGFWQINDLSELPRGLCII